MRLEKASDTEYNLIIEGKGHFNIMINDWGGEYPGVDIEYISDKGMANTASKPRVMFELPNGSDNPAVKVWEDPDSEDYTYEWGFDIARYEEKPVYATDIEWDINMDEVLEKLAGMEPEDTAATFGIAADKWKQMSLSERNDIAEDYFHHNRVSLSDFMGLPDRVEIPRELINDDGKTDEDISNWLSDTYGFCHGGFRLSSDTQS